MALANCTNCVNEFLIVAGGGGGNSESNNTGGDAEKNGYGRSGGKGATQDDVGKKGELIDWTCTNKAEDGKSGKGGEGGSNAAFHTWCGGGGGDGYYGGGGGNCGKMYIEGGGGGGSNYYNKSLEGYDGENKYSIYSGIIITRIKN